MATRITERFGDGGGNITKSHGGEATLSDALRDGIDDVAELRTQLIALLAKLDADAGVTDTDYASTLTPAAQTLTKG